MMYVRKKSSAAVGSQIYLDNTPRLIFSIYAELRTPYVYGLYCAFSITLIA